MPILDITFSTPLPSALMQVVGGLVGGDADEVAAVDQVAGRLERQVGVHRGGAVADQQRRVVHLADVAALDDEPDAGARCGHGSGGGGRRW